MPHSYTKVWIHVVLGTKFRRPYFQPEIEKKVYAFLKEQFKKMDCSVNIINGTEDHVHVLFRLSRNHSISHIIKTVKGTSSNWINKENLTDKKFEWQIGYAAFGVDYENLDRVFFYIRNQKLHHKKQDFPEEYSKLLSETAK